MLSLFASRGGHECLSTHINILFINRRKVKHWKLHFDFTSFFRGSKVEHGRNQKPATFKYSARNFLNQEDSEAVIQEGGNLEILGSSLKSSLGLKIIAVNHIAINPPYAAITEKKNQNAHAHKTNQLIYRQYFLDVHFPNEVNICL